MTRWNFVKYLIGIWGVLLIGTAGVIWMKFPEWLTSGESASTTLRNMGLIVAAAIGLPLAIWRSVIAERQANAARRQSEIATQNQLNERFQKGAEMLGNADIESVRIGGVHALARLASEHPVSFHLPVMQLFCAFVVDRTGQDANEQNSSIESGEAGANQTDAMLSEARDDAIGGRERDPIESAPAEFHGPTIAADREVGPVPSLAKDVREVMSRIAQRNEQQIELEKQENFRMDLADASLPGLIFHGADFSSFDLTKADLRRVRCWRTRFQRAVLPGADLSAANMIGADFRDADMRRVNLTAARLTGADLRNADLGLVDIVGQNLWKGALFPSTMRGVQLQGADLRGADFGSADMRGASLGGANVEKASLGGANLTGADLRAAKLKGAGLGRANLSEANLGGGADLTEAELAGADLTGARLGSANLSSVNLDGAILNGTDFAYHWRTGEGSPVSGLTQQQLDVARADSARPPILKGVLDSETGSPLTWRGRGLEEDAE